MSFCSSKLYNPGVFPCCYVSSFKVNIWTLLPLLQEIIQSSSNLPPTQTHTDIYIRHRDCSGFLLSYFCCLLPLCRDLHANSSAGTQRPLKGLQRWQLPTDGQQLCGGRLLCGLFRAPHHHDRHLLPDHQRPAEWSHPLLGPAGPTAQMEHDVHLELLTTNLTVLWETFQTLNKPWGRWQREQRLHWRRPRERLRLAVWAPHHAVD